MLALRLHGSAGLVWPGLARLSELTGVDKRNVRRTLGELAELGLIEIASTGKGRSSSRYRLTKSAERGPPWPGATVAPSEGATIAPREGATVAPLTDKEQGAHRKRAPLNNDQPAPSAPEGASALNEKTTPHRSRLLDRLQRPVVASEHNEEDK